MNSGKHATSLVDEAELHRSYVSEVERIILKVHSTTLYSERRLLAFVARSVRCRTRSQRSQAKSIKMNRSRFL